MISGRKRFDLPEARVLKPARQDDVPVHPVFPYDKRGEAHSHLKRYSGFLRQNRDGAIFFLDGGEPVKDRADRFRFPGEMWCERMTPTGVRLIAIRESPPAARTPPQRRFGARSSDRSSGNVRDRSDN
jgi:hypothetical protein